MNFELEVGKFGKKIFSEEQVNYVISKYLESIANTTVSIGKEFGVTYQTIVKLLKSNNVAIKSLREYRLKYEVDDDFFEIINSEEKAYWLGFLYADAYVGEEKKVLRVNLSKVDEGHLVKLNKSLKSNCPIKYTTKVTEDKEYYGAYLGIYRPKIVDDLVDKGCYQNKSLTLTFPSSDIVPDSLIHHFVRGYFDGDGSITYTARKTQFSNRRLYKIKITGTEQFTDVIKSIFESDTKSHKPLISQAYTVEFGGNVQTKRLYEYMYKDATVYLDRKYEKFQEMLNYIDDNPYVVWNKGMKNYKKENGE